VTKKSNRLVWNFESTLTLPRGGRSRAGAPGMCRVRSTSPSPPSQEWHGVASGEACDVYVRVCGVWGLEIVLSLNCFNPFYSTLLSGCMLCLFLINQRSNYCKDQSSARITKPQKASKTSSLSETSF